MKLNFDVNIEEIIKDLKDFEVEITQDMQKAVGDLAAITHAKVKEMANLELHSSKEAFMDSLAFEEIAPGIWVVSVDESGLWVEEGIKPNTDMKPGLLKNAKTSKSGTKYKVIPFDHTKGPAVNTPKAQMLVDEIKKNLKKEGIPFKGIEKNPNGSPKVGKLHVKDFQDPTGATNKKGSHPYLHGVSVYQTMTKTGSVRRDIMTFRTVSNNPSQQNKWIHPGLEAKKFLDRAYEFCQKIWAEQILPEILKKYEG